VVLLEPEFPFLASKTAGIIHSFLALVGAPSSYLRRPLPLLATRTSHSPLSYLLPTSIRLTFPLPYVPLLGRPDSRSELLRGQPL
jgi:hypothetical protein